MCPRCSDTPSKAKSQPQYEASARITFFDNAVNRYLATIRQLVILGAGFDTRAFRLPKEALVKSYEVDTPQIQAVKREMLKKAGIDSSEVMFVTADFENDNNWVKIVFSVFMDTPLVFT